MDDAALMEGFRARTLTHAEWTHEAHVRVAYLYVGEFAFEGALARLREEIQGLNAGHGVPESLTRGYHETITRAMLQIVAALARACGEAVPAAFYAGHPELHTKHVLRLFYSPGR